MSRVGVGDCSHAHGRARHVVCKGHKRRPPWRPRLPAIKRLLDVYRRNRRQRGISHVFNQFHPETRAIVVPTTSIIRPYLQSTPVDFYARFCPVLPRNLNGLSCTKRGRFAVSDNSPLNDRNRILRKVVHEYFNFDAPWASSSFAPTPSLQGHWFVSLNDLPIGNPRTVSAPNKNCQSCRRLGRR